jgi:hypothetical protein
MLNACQAPKSATRSYARCRYLLQTESFLGITALVKEIHPKRCGTDLCDSSNDFILPQTNQWVILERKLPHDRERLYARIREAGLLKLAGAPAWDLDRRSPSELTSRREDTQSQGLSAK